MQRRAGCRTALRITPSVASWILLQQQDHRTGDRWSQTRWRPGERRFLTRETQGSWRELADGRARFPGGGREGSARGSGPAANTNRDPKDGWRSRISALRYLPRRDFRAAHRYNDPG